MAERVQIAGAAAGSAGSAWRKLLSYSAKVAGNYVFNEANFAGLGQYLPCLALVSLTPGAGGATISVSTDNGTTWFSLATGTAQFGQFLYLDTASTFRLTITTNPTDVRIFVQ